MIKDEVIWITGASSGIGLALAKKLSQHNLVIASARSEDKLKQLADGNNNIIPLVFDVTDKSQIDRVKTELLATSPYLDRVIFSAGNCEYLDIEKPDWDIMESMLKVNYLGMVYSLDACLDLLKNANQPHLVGIGSQAALAPFTRAEAYGASKAAVHYWLDSLRIDLARFNIDVTTVLPGFVDTELTKKNDFSMPFLMSVEDAAERIIKALQARPMSFIFPKRLSLLLRLARVFPKRWAKLQQNVSR